MPQECMQWLLLGQSWPRTVLRCQRGAIVAGGAGCERVEAMTGPVVEAV